MASKTRALPDGFEDGVRHRVQTGQTQKGWSSEKGSGEPSQYRELPQTPLRGAAKPQSNLHVSQNGALRLLDALAIVIVVNCEALSCRTPFSLTGRPSPSQRESLEDLAGVRPQATGHCWVAERAEDGHHGVLSMAIICAAFCACSCAVALHRRSSLAKKILRDAAGVVDPC